MVQRVGADNCPAGSLNSGAASGSPVKCYSFLSLPGGQVPKRRFFRQLLRKGGIIAGELSEILRIRLYGKDPADLAICVAQQFTNGVAVVGSQVAVTFLSANRQERLIDLLTLCGTVSKQLHLASELKEQDVAEDPSGKIVCKQGEGVCQLRKMISKVATIESGLLQQQGRRGLPAHIFGRADKFCPS